MDELLKDELNKDLNNVLEGVEDMKRLCGEVRDPATVVALESLTRMVDLLHGVLVDLVEKA